MANIKRVIILGGYGNFGSKIAVGLLRKKIPVAIAGRNKTKGESCCDELAKRFDKSLIEFCQVDVSIKLSEQISSINCSVIVNAVGPFQGKDYSIAKQAIDLSVNYIDLADGRDFVVNIKKIDKIAKQKNVTVISGASTVPALSSAVLDEHKKQFKQLDEVIYGITPGAKTSRGLATVESILSYLGKPLKKFQGNKGDIYGWQNLYRQQYPELGSRWMASCDIPDLDIFPRKYKLKRISFSAGMESVPLHFSIWVLSWLVRLGLPIRLQNYSRILLRLSYMFDVFGSKDGGMHMILKGKGKGGEPMEKQWFIIARDNDGPNIPCVPAIILASKLYRGSYKEKGARECVSLISLSEYLKELEYYNVKTYCQAH